MPDRCLAETKRGTRCTATPVPGDSRCAWHTDLPEWVAKRQQWSADGGRKRSNRERAKKQLPTEPMTNAEAHAWVTVAFKRTLTGQMEPGVLNALANAAKTMSELAKASDLEERMTEIERRLGGKAS
ncbi:MAG: hypothetical protein QOJ59_573 [Thermomicrobiales bacterium]|jgi:hypothetical protein|nr:hypothetical protein [Thermomicrobiales bacterium]